MEKPPIPATVDDLVYHRALHQGYAGKAYPVIEWDCIEDAAGGVVPITMAIGLNEGFVQAGLDYPMKEVAK